MGTVFQRGHSWAIEYRLSNGKIKRESVGRRNVITKTMAREMLKNREQQIKLGQEDMLDIVIPTINEISPKYLYHQKEVKRIRSYARSEQAISHFSELCGTKKLNEISASDIDIYKQRRLGDGIKMNTIVRDLVVIRHLFNYAYSRKKFFGRNPVSESGLPQVNDKKERVLTIVEQDLLLKHSSPELGIILSFALNTCMRRDEVLFLIWDWVDMHEGYINLPHTHSKSKKSRKVPINKVVRKILLERKLQNHGHEYVFNLSDTKAGARTWLQREFRQACKRAGIEGLRFHDLRHTAATRLVEANVPLHAVAELLGHSSIRMTERYSHPQDSVIKGSAILATY